MASQNQTAYHAGAEAKGRTEEETREMIAKARALAAEAREKAGLTAQAARGKTSENVEAVKEKPSVTTQQVEDHTEGKEKTGGFLQQAGEIVMNVAQGTAEAVKSTLGIGEDNKHKDTIYGEQDLSNN